MIKEKTYRDCYFYPEKYSISDDGHIVNKLTGHYPKTRINNWGYEAIPLNYKGDQTTQYIHRLVALTFIPNPNNYPEVNHIDGNKRNNCYSNLEWTTSSKNQKHAFEMGLQNKPKGELNGMAKNKEEDVIRVCELLLEGYRNCEIRNLTGYTTSFIEKIKYGERWTHVTKKYGIKPKNNVQRLST